MSEDVKKQQEELNNDIQDNDNPEVKDNRFVEEGTDDWKEKYKQSLKEQEQIKSELEMLKDMLSRQSLPNMPEQTQTEQVPEPDESAKMYLEDEAWRKAAEYLLEQKLREKIAPIEQKVQPLYHTTEQMMLEQKRMELQRRHPDYNEIINSPNFRKYLETLPQTLVATAQYDVDTADFIMKNYKKEMNINTENTTKAFTTPSKKGSSRKKVWRRSELLEMYKNNPEKYRSLQPEIMLAYKEGRVVPE